MRAKAYRVPSASRELILGLAGLTLAACASTPRNELATVASPGAVGAPTSRYTGYKVGKPYQVKGVWYSPQEQPNYDEIGVASWYGEQFHNQYTADGEVFDMTMPSAAHKTLPLPSLVEVTNLKNGKTVIVRVNDRGPFVDGRIIDMSKAAAAELGMVAAGVTQVRVRYVGRAPDPPGLKTPQNMQKPDERLYKASLPRLPQAPSQSASSNLLQSATNVVKAPADVATHVPLPSSLPPVPSYQSAASAAAPVAAPVVSQVGRSAIADVDSLFSAPLRAAAPSLPVASAAPAPAVQAPARAPAAIAQADLPQAGLPQAPPQPAAAPTQAPLPQAAAPQTNLPAAAPAQPLAATQSAANTATAAAQALNTASTVANSANLAQQVTQGLPAPGYDLEAGTFATPQAAEHFAASLTGEGLPEVQTVRQGAQTVYRVVVHGLQSPAQVAAARSEAMALSRANPALATAF